MQLAGHGAQLGPVGGEHLEIEQQLGRTGFVHHRARHQVGEDTGTAKVRILDTDHFYNGAEATVGELVGDWMAALPPG